MDPVNPTIIENLFDRNAKRPQSHIYDCTNVCALVAFKIPKSNIVSASAEFPKNKTSGRDDVTNFHIFVEAKKTNCVDAIAHYPVLLNNFIDQYDIVESSTPEDDILNMLHPDDKGQNGAYICNPESKRKWLCDAKHESGFAIDLPSRVLAVKSPYDGFISMANGFIVNFDKSSFIVRHAAFEFTVMDSDRFHQRYSIIPEPCPVTVSMNGKFGEFIVNGVLSPLEVHEQLATQIGLCSKTWDFFAGGNVLRKFSIKPTRTTAEMLRRFNCLNVVEYFDDDCNSDCDNSVDFDPLDLGNPMVTKRPRIRSLSDDQNPLSDDQNHGGENSPLLTVVLNSLIMGRGATKTFKTVKNPFKKKRVENVKWAPKHQLDSPNEDLAYDFICKTQFLVGSFVCTTPGFTVTRKNVGFRIYCKLCGSRVKRGRFY